MGKWVQTLFQELEEREWWLREVPVGVDYSRFGIIHWIAWCYLHLPGQLPKTPQWPSPQNMEIGPNNVWGPLENTHGNSNKMLWEHGSSSELSYWRVYWNGWGLAMQEWVKELWSNYWKEYEPPQGLVRIWWNFFILKLTKCTLCYLEIDCAWRASLTNRKIKTRNPKLSL